MIMFGGFCRILPPAVLKAILTALGRLKQRVVARMPLEEIGRKFGSYPMAAANIFCMDYLPQAELMAHNKERLHGFSPSQSQSNSNAY